jgi:hypothetical protein
VHFLKFTTRQQSDAAGGQHTTHSGVFELSTTDGFSGRGAFHFTGVEDVGGNEFEIDVEISSQVLGNGTGQRVVAHGVAVDVRREGVTFVQFDRFTLECVGKP